jgi:uncharacterized coiled-coil DUF342 family protein
MTSRKGSKKRPAPSARKPDRAAEEIAFMEAMARYKQENRRPFPTWSEVLEVLHSLGYRKTKRSPDKEPSVRRLQQQCDSLREERDQLLLEMAKVKQDRDAYLKAVYALTWEDIEVPDKETVFAEMGKRPSLQELIAELEAQVVP